jgi:putative FmdB family regulatory protein
MPIYEYQCTQCSERQEVIQRFSDPPLSECPSCGGDMKKLPSSPAIQFKGSGFYKTDYAKGGSKSSDSKTSESKSSDSKSDGGGGSGKSDSSPSSAAESKSTSGSESSSSGKSASSESKSAE